MTINQRISALRAKMSEKGLAAVVLPSNDPHQSEYVADYWKIRQYFSGFTGSAGTLVITETKAALWTDSRYFLQVEEECNDNEVELYKQSIPHAPEHVKWLMSELKAGSKVGIDYRLFSLSGIAYLKEFADPKEIELVSLENCVEEIWSNRPATAGDDIKEQPVEVAGESVRSKLDKLIDELEEENADFNLITRLDEIAWLFNIRGNDVDFTPLVTAYALVGKDKSYLFVKTLRVPYDLKTKLNNDGVEIRAYSGFSDSLNELTNKKTVLTDKAALNYECFLSIKGDVIYKESKVRDLKSTKNTVELSFAREVMIRDGVALTRFFMWLEDYLANNTISEYDLGLKLESFRKEGKNYKGESFPAIVGYKGNGAIVHYTAPENGSATIENNGILLLDSGAQYLEGTTDITRTIWLGGVPSSELKTAYTSVLKGFIELETIQFPKGTVGMQLDILARMHLWRHGLNFSHGTGHGIGSYGMVHEPAQGFATSMTTFRGSTPHKANQLTTIEPGCYKKDVFGIRTENIVVSVERGQTEFGEFIGFESITRCHIDTHLIEMSQITPTEINWLNKYHANVYNDLKDHLTAEEQEWLKMKCEPIAIPTPSTI